MRDTRMSGSESTAKFATFGRYCLLSATRILNSPLVTEFPPLSGGFGVTKKAAGGWLRGRPPAFFLVFGQVLAGRRRYAAKVPTGLGCGIAAWSAPEPALCGPRTRSLTGATATSRPAVEENEIAVGVGGERCNQAHLANADVGIYFGQEVAKQQKNPRFRRLLKSFTVSWYPSPDSNREPID